MVSYPHHPGAPVVPALHRWRRFGHAETTHPGGYQPVCDRSEPAGEGMMQVWYLMPVEMYGDNEQGQYDIF